jgi:hypothetical protein
MTTLKGQEELDQYKLTRKEVADFLGISTNAVRMSQRGNNCHKLEYRFDGNQYLFKVPRRDPVITRSVDHPIDHPRTPKSTHGATPGLHKKIYNRGADARGEDNYTSEALRMHNEMKHRIALDKKFKSPEHKKAFMDMSEAGFNEAYEISKRAKLKRTQEDSRVPTPEVFPGNNPNSFKQSHGKYGHTLNAQGIAEGDRKALESYDRKYEQDNETPRKEEWRTQQRLDGTPMRVRVLTDKFDFRPSTSSYFLCGGNSNGFTGYGGEGDGDDPGSVEITQEQMYRDKPFEERTSFSNKIDESIYRTKLHLLRKKGGWD